MRLVIAAAVLSFIASAALAAAPAKPAQFDPADPAGLMAVLASNDAKAQRVQGAGGVVVLNVETPAGKFGVQFVGCDDNGKSCDMAAFSTAFQNRGPTLAQINTFNRSQVACRGYLTEDGRSSVMYGLLLTPRLSQADLKQHLGVWQSCLAIFGRFNRDPQSFLNSN
jgi:Putative bacterial sensory transduction regulator